MKIELNKITVKEIAEGYKDSKENGAIGYGGRLNIRPAFQREFVYNDEQRKSVINSIVNNFPLNVMYWVKSGPDSYEMLDGQQRTISICQYINGDFSLNQRSWNNLTNSEREKINNYELFIYFCEGTDEEKLNWFDIINLAGEKLSAQERRNAIYTGTWLTSAKEYFSKTKCAAYNEAHQYMSGSPIRQDYLETVIKWIASRDGIKSSKHDEIIREYMSRHQNDKDCGEMWLYFKRVIDWVKFLFPVYRKQMQGLPWGLFYNSHGQKNLNPDELEARIKALIIDDDVTSKSGIYEYLLDGEEKHLSIRKFSKRDKLAAYERQKGICPKCNKKFEIEEMDADHITPWSKGGRTIESNCQLLCKSCNRKKGSK